MIVYKFIDEKYGIENIKKRRLKMSRFLDLNDPFEFQCYRIPNQVIQEAVAEEKNIFQKSMASFVLVKLGKIHFCGLITRTGTRGFASDLKILKAKATMSCT